jgi:hypothetical protein
VDGFSGVAEAAGKTMGDMKNIPNFFRPKERRSEEGFEIWSWP